MHKRSYYLVNGITLYRILAAPVLIIFTFTGSPDLFKWLLALSFFTDVIDGPLARRYKVSSVLGSKLDSIADGLTILAAIIGLFVFKFDFISENFAVVIILIGLFLAQTVFALIKYRRITSFHTYLAKTAMILQGSFLILIFFFEEPPYLLFYAAAVMTGLDLIEEIILVFILPVWKANVKGIYWLLKSKEKN